MRFIIPAIFLIATILLDVICKKKINKVFENINHERYINRKIRIKKVNNNHILTVIGKIISQDISNFTVTPMYIICIEGNKKIVVNRITVKVKKLDEKD